VTDVPTLERVANLYASLGWPARASGGAITAEFSPPSADADRGISTRLLQARRLESRPRSRTERLAGALVADWSPRSPDECCS
jgi:hypothetical protein